jgi:hypothetical protein
MTNTAYSEIRQVTIKTLKVLMLYKFHCRTYLTFFEQIVKSVTDKYNHPAYHEAYGGLHNDRCHVGSNSGRKNTLLPTQGSDVKPMQC